MSPSVCIVTPGNLASNPRVLKEATALHSAGYRVTVVTGGAMPFLHTFGEAMASRTAWNVRHAAVTLRDRVGRRCGWQSKTMAVVRNDAVSTDGDGRSTTNSGGVCWQDRC